MKSKFRISISVKLITVTIGLLGVTTFILARESAGKFESISIDGQRQSSLEQSAGKSSEVEALLTSYIDKIKVVATLLLKDSSNPEEKAKSLDLTFGQDRELVSVDIVFRDKEMAPLRVVNETHLKELKKDLDKTYVDILRSAQHVQKMVSLQDLFNGKEGHIEIRNSTIGEKDKEVPLLTIGFPLAKDEYGVVTHVVLADIRVERLQKLFKSTNSIFSLFLVDDQGRLLAHSDEKRVLLRESLADQAMVKSALASKLKQSQTNFVEATTGESFISGSAKTNFGATVFAVASTGEILLAAEKMKREAYYIAGRIVSVALFLIFIFSITLTTPIENLAILANRVAKGEFSVKANVRSRDEVGELGEAFNHMIEGLLERDKVKSMFNKFHGSSVTEDLLKGDLQLGGSKKTVTVFFSDVRDFTKFSEGHTPEEVVSMLNEYFQIMVGIINKNGGVVDKFIGDAIMAVWGAPNSTERDPQNAVKACIEMRQALQVLNELREGRGQVPLKIGIGLHRGEAISGTVGSSERMEYTVIGDTVNQASRIESSTKAFGTDFLLSDTLADFVKDEFIVQEAGKVEVKGKSEPLKLYKVVGYYDEQKNPVIVRTPYSDYDAEAADKVKVA